MDLIDFYKKQFSIFCNTERSYTYKLKNIIPHINKVQWTFNEPYKISPYNPLNNDFGDYPDTSPVLSQTGACLKEVYEIYLELMEEKKLIQELCYILYYAKIADGDVVMTNYFNQIEEKMLSIQMDVVELSPMQRRVFKRFGSFILRGGIIDTEIAFNDYQKI